MSWFVNPTFWSNLPRWFKSKPCEKDNHVHVCAAQHRDMFWQFEEVLQLTLFIAMWTICGYVPDGSAIKSCFPKQIKRLPINKRSRMRREHSPCPFTARITSPLASRQVHAGQFLARLGIVQNTRGCRFLHKLLWAMVIPWLFSSTTWSNKLDL